MAKKTPVPKAPPRSQSRRYARPRESDKPMVPHAGSPGLWWLDEPIWSSRGIGPGFNPCITWFVDRLPGRARTLLFMAAQGKLRATGPGSRGLLPAVPTLRAFIALSTRQVLLQNCYGYKSHMALCRAFRDNGVTGSLFSNDEDRLKPDYIP